MAKFVWNVEDMKYRNLTTEDFKNIANSGEYSLQEMQDAWDEYTNATWKWTRVWEVFNLFEAEKDTIKSKGTDWRGRPYYNTNSLKAWANRNKVPYNSYYNTAGSFSYGWHRAVSSVNVTREEIEADIPLVFADLLSRLKDREQTYFLEHDEYSIKLAKINENLENHLPMPLKDDVSYYSHPFKGVIVKHNKDACYKDKERQLTIEELDKIIIFQNEVATAIKNVIDTKSPNIDI
jgi:hypothetical protein